MSVTPAPSSAGKNVLLGLVAVVLLAAAAVKFLYPTDEGKQPNTMTFEGVDLDTKGDVRLTVAIDATAPFLNPATGKHSVYQWYFCDDCQKRFVHLPSARKHSATSAPASAPGAAPGATSAPAVASAPAPSEEPFVFAVSCSECGGTRTRPWLPTAGESKPESAPLPRAPK